MDSVAFHFVASLCFVFRFIGTTLVLNLAIEADLEPHSSQTFRQFPQLFGILGIVSMFVS